MRSLLAAALLACALPVLAQADVENARRRIAAVDKLLQQRPADATLYFYRARSNAEAGDARAAAADLERVLELGDGFMPRRQDFAAAWEDAAFRAVREKLEARLPRLDYAPTAFELEDPDLRPEGIAYDAPSRTFFVGSTTRGKVLRVEEDGRAADFIPEQTLDAVLGIAVDAPRRLVYVVSTSALTEEGRKRLRNAVLAYDIDSRKLVQRYDVPSAAQLNDVAIAPGGRVFASDSASGAIYEIAVKGPGPSRLLLPPGQLGGSNGLASAPDGRRLYVGHSTGLAVVDIATGTMKRVENRTRENVAGFDGLYQWRGELVGVQNLTNPGRVVRVTLSPDGDAVVAVRTLLSHHHNVLDSPTTLAVTPHGFFLLAATAIGRPVAAAGSEAPASKPAVVRIPLPG
ncbi:MAG TPA: hypothetical protein VFK48_16170 [Usitatibacter sp.]|nr:hypothetical protein [Usitatibacter sp.]